MEMRSLMVGGVGNVICTSRPDRDLDGELAAARVLHQRSKDGHSAEISKRTELESFIPTGLQLQGVVRRPFL